MKISRPNCRGRHAGSRTRSADGRSKYRGRSALLDACQVTGGWHKADPQVLRDGNRCGQREGNEVARTFAAGVAAIAVVMCNSGFGRRERGFAAHRGNLVRSMTHAFMHVAGRMRVMDRADRHCALLPRHCAAVQAEHQDDQATKQKWNIEHRNWRDLGCLYHLVPRPEKNCQQLSSGEIAIPVRTIP